MMQSLHTSLNAAVVVGFGENPNLAAGLDDRMLKGKIVPALSRRANASRRSMTKRIVMKLHRPVEAPWSTHLPNSTLFLKPHKCTVAGRSWNHSVASPSRENLETTSDSQVSNNASKAESQFEAGISNKNLENDPILFTNGQGSSSAENDDCSHVSASLATKSVLQEVPDSGDQRQSDERSSNIENGTQADRAKVAVGERELDENEVLGSNGDNDHDILLGRKRIGRSKRKKKKAHCAGIATYDSRTNTIRLKGSATETPAAVHGTHTKRPRLRKCRPIEEMRGAEAKSEWNAEPLEEVIGSIRDLDLGNGSTGKSLGVEEAARLSRLLGLEDVDNNELQPNPTLVTHDDVHRESQVVAADAPEVALKSRPTVKFSGARKISATKGPEQISNSTKWESKPKGVDLQAAASNEVDPRKHITEDSQVNLKTTLTRKSWKSEYLESEVFDPVLNPVPEPIVDQVGAIIDQVTAQVNEQIQQVRTNVSVATESLTSTAGHVADSISSTATQVTESVASTAAKLSSSLNVSMEYGADSEDEFEESSGSDNPEFRGLSGLRNYIVLQDDEGVLVKLRDFYFFMMKKPLPEFALGMMAAPLALSMVFTLLYLPEFQGLAYDETARDFLNAADGTNGAIGLELSWMTFFRVFMFSLSLSTGLEPDLAPLSPYTLVVANLNALLAQLILAFLSAAAFVWGIGNLIATFVTVFARLSQPSEPVRCSSVALICALNKRRDQMGKALNKVLLTRCVLAGPQPCELVNVKVDLTYRFNTVSSDGSFFRGSCSLKLVRSQIPLLDQGMLVRHIIDESSPLYFRTPGMLRQDDAIFVLSVAGLERSSMQPIFHVQFYSVCDEQVIWNAEFEDMILVNQKNQRVVDHSKLSSWKSL